MMYMRDAWRGGAQTLGLCETSEHCLYRAPEVVWQMVYNGELRVGLEKAETIECLKMVNQPGIARLEDRLSPQGSFF